MNASAKKSSQKRANSCSSKLAQKVLISKISVAISDRTVCPFLVVCTKNNLLENQKNLTKILQNLQSNFVFFWADIKSIWKLLWPVRWLDRKTFRLHCQIALMQNFETIHLTIRSFAKESLFATLFNSNRIVLKFSSSTSSKYNNWNAKDGCH